MACFECDGCYKVIDCWTDDAPNYDYYPIPNCLPDGYLLRFQTPATESGADYVLIFEKENGVTQELLLTSTDPCGQPPPDGCPVVDIPASFLNRFLAGYEGLVKISIRSGGDYDRARFSYGMNCDPYDTTEPHCVIMKVVDRKMSIPGLEDGMSLAPFA